MSSDFRIQVGSGGDIYELAVTTEVKVSAKNSITSHKTESKEVITSNAVVFNKEISYNGKISTIRRVDQAPSNFSLGGPIQVLKTLISDTVAGFIGLERENNYRTPKDYLEGLDKVRQSREFVTCFLTNDLNPISNCLIEHFEYTKDQNGGLSCWNVNLRLKEVRLTTKATETTVPRPATKDATTDETDNGNAATEEDTSLITTGVLGDLFG